MNNHKSSAVRNTAFKLSNVIRKQRSVPFLHKEAAHGRILEDVTHLKFAESQRRREEWRRCVCGRRRWWKIPGSENGSWKGREVRRTLPRCGWRRRREETGNGGDAGRRGSSQAVRICGARESGRHHSGASVSWMGQEFVSPVTSRAKASDKLASLKPWPR